MSDQKDDGLTMSLDDGKLGISTLKKGIAVSEDKILLRQLALPKRHSLSVPHLKHTTPANGVDNDSPDSTSTTSEVNSEDDATSIVSRLSQIIVEQEERLHIPPNIFNQDDGKISLEPETRTSTMKQVRSYVNVGSSDGQNGQHQGDLYTRRCSDFENPWTPRSCAEQKRAVSPESLPAIQVNYAENRKLRDKTENGAVDPIEAKQSNYGQRSKSITSGVRSFTVGDGSAVDQPEELPSSQFEAPSYRPERGNLRELESSRGSYCPGTTNPMRSRANTTGSVDRSALFDEDGQLNIKRAAWTLSQFDDTFYRNSNDDPDTGSATELERTATTSSLESLNILKTGLEKGPSDNLLIRASKNALNLKHHSLTTDAIPTQAYLSVDRRKSMGDNCIADRRMSHCHSIVSLSSSMESLHTPVKPIFGSQFGHRKPNGDSRNESNNFCNTGQCCNLTILRRYLPIFEWLPSYKISLFWGDLTAGLAVAVLNISTSLSAAVVAETELSTAFRSSIINTFVYAILCSSRHTSFGSWSIMSQLLVVSVRKALSDELILNRINLGPSTSWEPEEYEMWHLNIIIMYTFLIGLIQLICGLLNLGSILASFIPEALASSMIAATAFIMAIGQLANMCGTSNKILWSIEKNTTELWADLKNPPVDITDLFAGLFRWIQQIALLVKYHDEINVACVIISITSVILLYLNQYVLQVQLKRIFKRNIFLPFEIILLIMAISASYALDLKNTYKVATCGPIFIDFVKPSLPDLRLFGELWYDALATALISYTMVSIMAKTYGNKLNYEVDCNQELIACGAGNLVGGMFDALPATASFSRTAGQVEAGGKTQMASIVNCIVLIALAQLLGHHVAVLPVCVMAATLFFGFVRMMSRMSEVLVYWRICKVDFCIWIVTFVAILSLDLVSGFVYGFIFSILTMLYRAQNRRCYMLGTICNSEVFVPLAKYPLAHEIEGIKIFQFCGPIHYVCADLFERLLRQKTRVNVKELMKKLDTTDLDGASRKSDDSCDSDPPTHIILDFSMISYIDSAGIHMIKKIIEDHNRVNITIFIASLASHVAAVVKSEPSLWGIHKERFYVTLADAVHCAMRDSLKRNHNDVQVKA